MSKAKLAAIEARAYRGAGSWGRFLPAVALSAVVHGALLFPVHLGLIEARDGASEAAAGGTQLAADVGALEKMRAELVRAAVETAMAREGQAEPVPAPEPPTEMPIESPQEPTPDHSERKAIEGLESELAPEEVPEAPAEPASELAEVTPEPAVEPVVESSSEPVVEPEPEVEREPELPASERERQLLRERLDEVASSGGHLAAAWKRFEAQAAAQRDPRRGAAGSDHGLPQLYVLDLPLGRAFVSYLELFGGEVLAHAGGERFVHFVRRGERFDARALSRVELDRLAVARGLNLGYAHALDDVMAELPDPLQKSIASARAAHGGDRGTWSVFVLGTTREQAAVATAAQEHLRHHREEAPAVQLWSQLERIEFRYLSDEREQIYGVRIDAVHGAR
ncbi:MAG: hypothetical protein JNM84_19915 [Planctomycetes bacterium]|nr:hypothetical protein [Planctomycetota bacterium]